MAYYFILLRKRKTTLLPPICTPTDSGTVLSSNYAIPGAIIITLFPLSLSLNKNPLVHCYTTQYSLSISQRGLMLTNGSLCQATPVLSTSSHLTPPPPLTTHSFPLAKPAAYTNTTAWQRTSLLCAVGH